MSAAGRIQKQAPGAIADRQFFKLECTYSVGAEASASDLTCDAYALVSSAVGVLLLRDLTNDADFAVLHLLQQATGLLSLAQTLHEQQQFAEQSSGAAA